VCGYRGGEPTKKIGGGYLEKEIGGGTQDKTLKLADWATRKEPGVQPLRLIIMQYPGVRSQVFFWGWGT
tara:strand:- start:4390 stop:4596 length:207 start_codon:yes stop_codon:yes gene_type:complete